MYPGHLKAAVERVCTLIGLYDFEDNDPRLLSCLPVAELKDIAELYGEAGEFDYKAFLFDHRLENCWNTL